MVTRRGCAHYRAARQRHEVGGHIKAPPGAKLYQLSITLPELPRETERVGRGAQEQTGAIVREVSGSQTALVVARRPSTPLFSTKARTRNDLGLLEQGEAVGPVVIGWPKSDLLVEMACIREVPQLLQTSSRNKDRRITDSHVCPITGSNLKCGPRWRKRCKFPGAPPKPCTGN